MFVLRRSYVANKIIIKSSIMSVTDQNVLGHHDTRTEKMVPIFLVHIVVPEK